MVRQRTTCLLHKLVAALQVHTAALDAAVAASAAGQQTPFSSLLEGSAEDFSLDDIRDYFCYAQIHSQVSICTACFLALRDLRGIVRADDVNAQGKQLLLCQTAF